MTPPVPGASEPAHIASRTKNCFPIENRAGALSDQAATVDRATAFISRNPEAPMTTSVDAASTPQEPSTEFAPLSRRDVLISSVVLPAAAIMPAAAQAAGEAPRALTARTRDNLVAFSRLLGHVRHFHPSDQAARGGVAAAVPLVLEADADGTLPHRPQPAEPASGDAVFSGNDRATRLAAVALGWNVLQHFYPYFDLVKTDWEGALGKALEAAATDRDETDFLKTLRRMVAALHDGHGRVFHASERSFRSLPIAWRWVEDRLVITAVAPEAAASGLKIGDIVESIDGRPSAQALADVEQLISAATPQWKRDVARTMLARGAPDAPVRLRVARAGAAPREVDLVRTADWMAREARLPVSAELKPGVWYLDLDRATDADFAAALPKLVSASGVIFDLRGYPKMTTFLQHLTATRLRSPVWQIPVVSEPDRQGHPTWLDTRWNLEPLSPRIAGKVAFVTDGSAISFAETVMQIVEAHRLGAIVGGPTAGTNGNINPFVLPGGYRINWTGMRVTDGGDHHGVGVHPTVPVAPTLKGIAEGRDEVLERAIEVVS
jgi:C-terminal processing protease CtpA/Prc